MKGEEQAAEWEVERKQLVDSWRPPSQRHGQESVSSEADKQNGARRNTEKQKSHDRPVFSVLQSLPKSLSQGANKIQGAINDVGSGSGSSSGLKAPLPAPRFQPGRFMIP